MLHALAKSFLRALAQMSGAGEGPDLLRGRWISAVEEEDEGLRDRLLSVVGSRCDAIEAAK